jgi:hypothetical protein
VAIAYVLQKTPYVFPIIGGRKVEHFMANLEALDIVLTNKQVQELESVLEFDIGFPGWMIISEPQGNGTDYTFLMRVAANYEKPLVLQTYRPTTNQ